MQAGGKGNQLLGGRLSRKKSFQQGAGSKLSKLATKESWGAIYFQGKKQWSKKGGGSKVQAKSKKSGDFYLNMVAKVYSVKSRLMEERGHYMWEKEGDWRKRTVASA